MAAKANREDLCVGIAAALSLCWPAAAAAGVDVCSDPPAASQLSVAYDAFDSAMLDGGRGVLEQTRIQSEMLLRSPNEQYFLGLGHHYSILDFAPELSQSNGHLHTFFLPLHRQVKTAGNEFRITIAPALSASSNAMQHLDDYADDAFQLLAALVWRRNLSARVALRYGLCGDHGFGDYRVYPVLGLSWRPNADWTIDPGFPVSAASYRISTTVTATISLQPDGNAWYARNRDLSQGSKLADDSYAVLGTLDWRLHDSLSIVLRAGKQIDSEITLTPVGGRRFRLATEDTTRWSAALAWHF